VVAGLCTALLGGPSGASLAQPAIIEQSPSRTPQTITGELTPTSSMLENGSFYATHSFEGTAGEGLAIELTSEDFDTYLILIGPDEAKLAEDDDGAEGTNSQIVITLPTTGTYTLIANTLEAGQTGQYQLAWRAATARDQDLALANQLNQQVMSFTGQAAIAKPFL